MKNTLDEVGMTLFETGQVCVAAPFNETRAEVIGFISEIFNAATGTFYTRIDLNNLEGVNLDFLCIRLAPITGANAPDGSNRAFWIAQDYIKPFDVLTLMG